MIVSWATHPFRQGNKVNGLGQRAWHEVLERVDPAIDFPWGTEGFFGQRPPPGQLSLELPAGRYVAEWFDPVAPKSLGRDEFSHAGGVRPVAVRQVGEETVLRLEHR